LPGEELCFDSPMTNEQDSTGEIDVTVEAVDVDGDGVADIVTETTTTSIDVDGDGVVDIVVQTTTTSIDLDGDGEADVISTETVMGVDADGDGEFSADEIEVEIELAVREDLVDES